MSDIAAEFDARFKGQTGFDSLARGAVAQGGVDDSRIVVFPKEWLRDNYSRGSQDRELASSMFFYCVQLLWEDSQSVKDKRQQQRAKIRNMSERADELIARADAWAKSAKVILAEFRKDKTVSEALQAKINRAGGPLPEYVQKVQMQAKAHKDRKRTLAKFSLCFLARGISLETVAPSGAAFWYNNGVPLSKIQKSDRGVSSVVTAQ